MKKFFVFFLISIVSLCSLSTIAYEGWKWTNPRDIAVYIPQNDNKTELMKKAFEDWEKKTKNNLAFRFVKSPEESDIDVTFIEKDLTDYCGSPEAMGCAKNYFYNGKMHSKIFITKRRPKGLLLSNTQVYAVMRHEIGHTLGLAHSKKFNDIMFASTNLGIAIRQDISDNDISAVYSLYGIIRK